MTKEEIDIESNAVYADIDKIDIEQFKSIFSKGGGTLSIYCGDKLKNNSIVIPNIKQKSTAT